MTSLYIDDELHLDQKGEFIDRIHGDDSYYKEARELLEQERLLRSDVFEPQPEEHLPVSAKWPGRLKKIMRFLWRPFGFVAVAVTCALLVMVIQSIQRPGQKLNRFVIYRPDVTMVEITGSFTKWERVPLQKIGGSGYWEVLLNVPTGEHRFTYILNGENPYADPTVLSVENDDFGGVNSIINIGNES